MWWFLFIMNTFFMSLNIWRYTTTGDELSVVSALVGYMAALLCIYMIQSGY